MKNATKSHAKNANATGTKGTNAKDAQNAANAKGTPIDTEPTEPKKTFKLNADSFKDWTLEKTLPSKKGRLLSERKEDDHKPRLTRYPWNEQKNSPGYRNIAKLTWDINLTLTGIGREFYAPQDNAELIRELLNKKLPADKKLVRFSYVARQFELRFFPANARKDTYIALDVSKELNPNVVLKTLGYPTKG